MSENDIGNIRFDVGLENIARLDGEPAMLPAQREVKLTGGKVPQRVDELFKDESLNTAMRRFAAPHLGDPTVLMPARFEHLIKEGARSLREMAQDSGKPELQRAGKVLDEEMQLRNLLASYRSALVQG